MRIPGSTPRATPLPPALILPLLAAATALLPHPAPGQETESALSPAGRLRLEVAPSFVAWDQRFGLRTEGGRTVEELEPLGFDLGRPDASELFPGVASLESALRSLLDDPGFSGSLGSTGAVVSSDRVTVPFRLDVGVLDRLTVGVTVPLVKSRTEIDFAFDSTGANLGANPAVSDPGGVSTWIDGLSAAATAAGERASELCGSDPSSSACDDATSLADDLDALRSGLWGAYGSSYLFPVATSPAGSALLDHVQALSQRLDDAGLGGFSGELPMGSAIPDRATFEAFVEQAFATPPPADRVGLWELGDVEVHAVVRLSEGVLRDSAEAPVRARWQVGAGGLVRLGTGKRDDPDVTYDLGSGDGQTDVEGRLFANLGWRRFGLWADARYGVQLATTLPRRIGPPDLVFVSQRSSADVEWTPGNYLRLEVAPRFHMTDELAISGAYRLWSKGEDAYERISEPPPVDPIPWEPRSHFFTDASLLELETEETRHELGAGLVYNTLAAWREGRAPLPLEGRLTVRWAVAGSGGRTPQAFHTQVSLRLYRRLWGG